MRELKPESKNRIMQAFSKTDYNVSFLWEETEMQGKHRMLPVKCNLCNGIEKYHVSNLQRAKYSCTSCRDIRIKEKASELNFEYLGKLKNTEDLLGNKIRLVLRCKVDQSITNTQTFHLLDGSVRCRDCAVSRYKSALGLKDCEYVSHGCINGAVRVTFRNKSGETRTIRSSNLLTSSWTTSDNLSSWTQKYYCYCFWFYLDNDDKLPSGLYYKIGVSNNPHRRLKSLKLTFNANIEILGEFTDRFLATGSEKLLHSTNNEYKLNPEVVKIFSKGLALRKDINGKRCKVRDGITEWFYNKEGNNGKLLTTN